MDLYKAIQELYAEKERLERVIASLEQLQRTGGVPEKLLRKSSSRRGRKNMDAKERQEVSERMKKYWADRRDAGRRSASSEGAAEDPISGESAS